MDRWEDEYLAAVHERLDADIRRLTGFSREESRSIREDTREYMSENPFAAVYGRSEAFIRETGERIGKIEETERRLTVLRDMKKAPYFGRVDFVYEDEDEAEKIYIGISTLLDEDTGKIYIYDWRAPVCSLFYNGETGPASYKAPMGEIGGEIRRIRQYEFKNGVLKGFWDADLRIDDAVLRQVLSGAAGDKMKPIVCTIQREQNRAIRFDRKQDVCVFGPAGSGKTSVGVHRLSWLMYEMRMAGYVPNVLMFTANEAFRSYVSGVLPDLGEEELETVDFAELFETLLPGYAFDTPADQSEAILDGGKERLAFARALNAPSFLAFADEQLRSSAPHFRNIRLYGETIVKGTDMAEKYSALPGGVNARKRLLTVSEWVESEIRNYFLIHKKDLENRLLNESEDGDSYTFLYKQLRDSSLGRAKQMVLDAVKSDPASLYLRYVQTYFGKGDLLDGLRERVADRTLWFEDGVMMLYIAAMLGRAVPKGTPTHVLIDEAQDLSLLQHKTIRALYPKAVFTVLADLNQGILPGINMTEENALAAVYGAKILRLTKSYRATKPLGTFSKTFLPEEKREYEVFDREGDPPFAVKTDDPVRSAGEILSSLPDSFKSVGILLKTRKEAKRFFDRLQPVFPALSGVFTSGDKLRDRVTVMPATLSKGLEFDCVIVPEWEEVEKEPALAYLLTTRALHRLYLLSHT